MKFKKYNLIIVITLILIPVIFFFLTRPIKTSARNLIFILVDTLRSDHLRCYGYSREISPNIDYLAEKGILFENSLAQSSWTKPSFTSIMTANHPTSVGITGMNDAVIDNITTVTELLKKEGYYTVAFISNPYLGREHGFAQGFDEYHTVFPTNLSVAKINADELNEEVFKWLDKNKNKKFFLLIFYLDPHTPYAPPEPYDKLFSAVSRVSENLWKEKISNPSKDYLNALINLYDGEIRFFDHELGKLFERLKKLNLWEKSLIAFNADHGEEFYDHFWWQHNHTLYEELLRVPLIIYGPGLPEGIRVKAPIQHIEIFPTLFDLLGLDQSDTFTGQSATSLIKNPDKEINKLSYHETYMPGKEFIAARGTKWKIIFNVGKNTYQFFDLKNDPLEKKDLLKSSGGTSSIGLTPEIKKNFQLFKDSLHRLAKQAYKLRHQRRAFRNVKYDQDALRMLEGIGYISN
jgi:arylsulfatase A-like enzyme